MKKRALFCLISLLFFVVSCSRPETISQPLQLTGEPTIDDNSAIVVETSSPTDELDVLPTEVVGTIFSEVPVIFESAGADNTYWVINPTSQARLFVQVVHDSDWNGSPQPGLVLVPGGLGSGGSLMDDAKILAARGFSVVVFDPDGRGRSEGDEDWNGFTHQDGLAQVIRFTQQLAETEKGNVGVISYSYGVTMATGALARHPDLGVIFYIDWEGPVDRLDTTTTPDGECHVEVSRQNWKPCDDEDFWSEREAITFMGQVLVPAYQRIQSEEDHVQPDVTHAIRIVNQAIAAGIGWVRLNDLPVNQTYDENKPPKMVAEALDKNLNKRIGDFALELFQLFGN